MSRFIFVVIVLCLNSYLLSVFLLTTVKGVTNTNTNDIYSLKGALEGNAFFSHTEKSALEPTDLQLSIIVRFYFVCVCVFVVDTDSTTIYLCPEQPKHGSQTSDGSGLQSFQR